MEVAFFGRLPGYGLIRGLTQRLAGDAEGTEWTPALVEIEDALVPGFIIEVLDDGRITVFVPSVPTPLAGAVYILVPERVHVVDVPFTQPSGFCSSLGLGVERPGAAMRKGWTLNREELSMTIWPVRRFTLIGGCRVHARSSLAGPSLGTPDLTGASEGGNGPDHWGALDKTFEALPCRPAGGQSPIDIRSAKPADLPAIQFAYQPTPLHIINNGHTIQVNYAPGSFITVGDKRYQLKQFHFHHPSEERIDGKGFAMVAHLRPRQRRRWREARGRRRTA